MKIDSDVLQKIAHLARLQLSPAEEPEMAAKLEAVLNWMEQLNEVDTEHVAPLTHMTLEVNAFRADVASTTISREEGLSNAPAHTDKFFKINKVK
jgi:aspartyl-tRNA(Asn)/glutamyl-tRNA(Gln) amidotransferase subunit C